MEDLGLQSPVIELRLRYLKPARYDDMITVSIRITRYTGVRLSIAYRVSANDALLCTGESEHTFLYAGRLAALQKTCPEIHELLTRCAQVDDKVTDESANEQPASALS